MRRDERNITEFQCIEDIIRQADVCRIALANKNVPYIVTMNFGYTGEPERRLYFHCANEGRKLDMIRLNNFVCFEMDIDHKIRSGFKGCDWGFNFKSVVGYGTITIITEKESKIRGLDCIMKHYGGDKKFTFDENVLKRTTVLALDISEMTGKKC
jgi:nitroimidazol reductase NimA-like FMN-containing flavoprotein (pyridoxamine 5'-phosphate oxidase superfamily)